MKNSAKACVNSINHLHQVTLFGIVDPYSPEAIEECLKSGEPVVFSDYGSKDGHHAYLVTGVKTCSDGSHSLYMIDPLTGCTTDIHWSTIQNMNVKDFEFTQFAKYTNTNYKLR